MVTKRFKYIFAIYFVLLVLVALRNQIDHIPFMDNPFANAANFIVRALIVIGILFHWATTILQRVMHKDIKMYIITIVSLQIFWLSFRNFKWLAFEFANIEARFSWYLFYIPMILIPMFFFFIALSVSKDESYKLNPKWNLLFIPAIILILIVLTNDYHQLVFQFNPNFENWDRGYSYGIIYPVIVVFMTGFAIVASIVLFYKWRKINKMKGAMLIIFVSSIAIAYIITYIFNRPLASMFLDLTVFNCMIYILFFETFIQVGLVRSNNHHQEIFEKADISAQILDENGKIQYNSIGDIDISKADFMSLKENKKLMKDENIISHIEPIHGGYVTWNSDITDINQKIKEINITNKSLYDEVELLQRVNEQEMERVHTQKQNAIQDAIFTEVKPKIEQIKGRILQSKEAKTEVKKQCLYEISIISAYIKRKINLLLVAQTRSTISMEEIAQCFNESFQNLEFCGSVCYLNMLQNYVIDIETATLTYDLFEKILEKVCYCPKEVFITYNMDENKINFSIRISAKQIENMTDVIKFEKEKFFRKGLSIIIEKEEDGYYIAVVNV